VNIGARVVSGLIVGLLFGLLFGLLDSPLLGLISGLVVGLTVGWSRVPEIRPVETLTWSWLAVQKGIYTTLLLALFFGLVLGLFAGLRSGLASGLVFGLGSGLVIGLIGLLVDGLVPGEISVRTMPNEGIRRSVRSAVLSWLVVCLSTGVGAGVVGWLTVGLRGGVFFGLALGSAMGLLFCLNGGGYACLQHLILRIMLWRNDFAPWDYIRFLDHAHERIFLRKVGGGYIFVHRLMMEYFATLEPQPMGQERQAPP
jgi:hypothetical protein